MQDFHYRPIGIIHSCFTEKFGTPRQAGLVPMASATLELLPPFDNEDALRGISGFSHIWLLWHFHAQTRKIEWQPTVRPPRLGGQQRIGVFASRSPFRPNPIGMSAVRLNGIERCTGSLRIHLQGVDLMDGTPVLDIKPYLPYSDALSAQGGYAESSPDPVVVRFLPDMMPVLARLEKSGYDGLQKLIEQVLGQDPRPAYQAAKQAFAICLFDLNIHWQVTANGFLVTQIREP